MDRELRVRFECVCGQMFEVAATLTGVDAMNSMIEAMTAAHAGCVRESEATRGDAAQPEVAEVASALAHRIAHRITQHGLVLVCAADATYTPPGFSGVMSTPLTCQLGPDHQGWHEDYSNDSQRTTVYRWGPDGKVVASAREL